MTDRIQIVVGVPESHLQALLEAIGNAGAGVIGNYTHCSFTNTGIGRFKPNASANPAVGERNALNTVEECRIETVCARGDVRKVCAAIRAAHPYEEPVIYLLPLLDEHDFA